MQSIVFLLIWRGSPAQSYGSWDVLFQLNGTWRFGVICKQDLVAEIEITDIKTGNLILMFYNVGKNLKGCLDWASGEFKAA